MVNKKEQIRKRKRISIFRILFYMIIMSALISGGFILGMVYQQQLIKVQIIDILSYSDLEVNINMNHTKLVDDLQNRFIPAWKEAFNQTLYSELNLTSESND